MKVPSLEEFKIKTISRDEIDEAMKLYKVGYQPVYFDLSRLKRERLIELLALLSNSLEEQGLSPKFPYPFYIITDLDDIWTSFPVIRTIEDLPRYYKIEANRPSTKEQKLLDFIDISASNIRNEDIQTSLDEFNRTISSQRIIKTLSSEASKLEKILKILDEQ